MADKIEFGPIEVDKEETKATWCFSWTFAYVKTGGLEYGHCEVPYMTFEEAYKVWKEQYYKKLFDPMHGYIKKFSIDKIG